MPSKVRRNILGQMGAKDCCNQRLEAATFPEILHLFGQGNLTLSGKSQGILKTDVCGNHDEGKSIQVIGLSRNLTKLHQVERVGCSG